ncbi:MAG: hypothetical protein V7672_00745 [Brevundimonas sp.]|uniref:hypothetical protein n=1 Tax=Brevundimonas sp. TaxID=1871086 RepID=UPI00300241B1
MTQRGPFSATVDAWTRQTKERMSAVHKESAQRTVEVMQTPRGAGGNLRVDTGFLWASLVGVIGENLPPQTTKPDDLTVATYDAGPISLVIAEADLTDTISVAYTANYAVPREYGSRGQPGDRWVALAAQQWPQIVSQVVTEAKARAGA